MASVELHFLEKFASGLLILHLTRTVRCNYANNFHKPSLVVGFLLISRSWALVQPSKLKNVFRCEIYSPGPVCRLEFCPRKKGKNQLGGRKRLRRKGGALGTVLMMTGLIRSRNDLGRRSGIRPMKILLFTQVKVRVIKMKTREGG
ncbi:unnamed protein product [Sphenostylis stenocarpa]|uniref:Uncharacterized protein n=1 Tax=Sphenostylis stenocarpa TaxID=92480 RepID=A0AA87B719_9FABA|nr:unnamed protein product [Sphenostylis stenocarpa]